jgi:hypothetical protein
MARFAAFGWHVQQIEQSKNVDSAAARHKRRIAKVDALEMRNIAVCELHPGKPQCLTGDSSLQLTSRWPCPKRLFYIPATPTDLG